MSAELIGTSDDGEIEFFRVGDEVFRVGKRWMPDIHGNPMGMRWECSFNHWKRYLESVYSWVVTTHTEEKEA